MSVGHFEAEFKQKLETRNIYGEEIRMSVSPQEARSILASLVDLHFMFYELNEADTVVIDEVMAEDGVEFTTVDCLNIIIENLTSVRNWLNNLRNVENGVSYELTEFETECDETWPNGRDLYFEGEDEDWERFATTMRGHGIECHSSMFFPGPGEVGLAYAICRVHCWPFGS